jgi:hypothetical protein
MRDVNDFGSRVDPMNHALHGGNVVVGFAKVGCQSYQRSLFSHLCSKGADR